MNDSPRCFSAPLAWLVLSAALLLAPAAHAIYIPYQNIQEFVNENTGRRFLTANAEEQKILLSGQVGGGWRSTGLVFAVSPLAPDQKGVCRFYAPALNAHFYTLSDFECELLKSVDAGWRYEGIAFQAIPPESPACLHKIHRLYGQGSHRYTASPEVREKLAQQGYVDEGPAFCANGAYSAPFATYELTSGPIMPTADCENEDENLGACVALNQTSKLPFVYEWTLPALPSGPVAHPSMASHLTGVDGILHSSIADPTQVTTHSFVQLPPIDGYRSGFGIYVNGRDFSTTVPNAERLMSINPIYQFRTRSPADGEADRRLMPWRDSRFTRSLLLSFYLRVAHVRRSDSSAHAIAHPVIELLDTRSGRNLYITIGAAQTVPLASRPEDDYFAFDSGTGKVIVSTSFRNNPSFGTVQSGQTFFCEADAVSHSCNANPGYFSMLLSAADIAAVVRKARTLDPALSPNIADYAIDNFSFNNELLNNAQLGLYLADYTLRIYEE